MARKTSSRRPAPRTRSTRRLPGGIRAAKRRPVKPAAPAAPTRTRRAVVRAERAPAAPVERPAGAPVAETRPPAAAAPVSGGTAKRRRIGAEQWFNIPTQYGQTRIVLMVKDPWWLYTYWEIEPRVERDVRRRLLPADFDGVRTILRVYDVTGREFPREPAHGWQDVALSGMASSWYLHTNAPGRAFIVEIGLLTKSGRFLPLARSNRVEAPPFGPSDVVDDEWMTTEELYWKLFGMTAGLGMGSSPTAVREWLSSQPSSSGMFSPGLFSPTKSAAPRGFWLVANAEVVVYGATDPRASVTIQGQPVTLRPDGSFSVRMALPDGTHTIPVEATSPDKIETRMIMPIVTRQTESRTTAPASAEPQASNQRVR